MTESLLSATDTPPQLKLQGGVATITLNRPAHRNRLHSEDLQVLMHHFQAINHNSAIQVVVLTGQVLPERPVFCAGYHIGQHGGEHAQASFEAVADALESLRPVTVCALNGSVYGGATDFVLACDFAIGVENMEMRMPAAALGMHYYPGGISRYVSRLGVTNAKRAFLGAEVFDAPELLRMGYIQQLVATAHHDAAVKALVTRLLALAPLALQTLKASLNEVARGEFDATRLRQRQHATQASRDFFEGCQAFAQRRKPVFTGQ
jgi:enoyl-CoA hydratase/carnithine racemase